VWVIILFDLFCGGKTPVEAFDENGNPIDAAVPEVNETTPEFRDIYISNVVRDGAGQALS